MVILVTVLHSPSSRQKSRPRFLCMLSMRNATADSQAVDARKLCAEHEIDEMNHRNAEPCPGPGRELRAPAGKSLDMHG